MSLINAMPKYIEVDSKVILSAIKTSAWFRGLPNDVVESLTDVAKVARYETGQIVYGVKSEQKHVYGILNGQVKISLVGGEEQYFSIIDFHNHFWFGDSSLLNSQSNVIDVTVLKNSEIIIIPAIELQAIADQCPAIYRNLYYDKSRQVQLIYNMFTSVLTYPLTARLSLRLLALVDERGFNSSQGTCLTPAPTITEWARLAMGSEQRVEKIIQKWITLKYIILDPDNNRFFIPNIKFFEIEAAN